MEELILERQVLQREYECVLKHDLRKGLENLKELLADASSSLNFNFFSPERGFACKPEKFLLASPCVNQQVKCMVTVVGDLIYEADLALKLTKQQMVPYQTRIYPENPWKLQQIQDAKNQLSMALSVIENLEGSYNFTSGVEALDILDTIANHLQLGQECLSVPKRKTLEEIVKNPTVKSFSPSIPQDTAVSFYVQDCKLILAVYHLFTNQMNRVDISARFQVECTIPWLNEMLLLFTSASQMCQQLKDKISLLMGCLDYEQTSAFDLPVVNRVGVSDQSSLLIDLTPECKDIDKRWISQSQDGTTTLANNNMMVN